MKASEIKFQKDMEYLSTFIGKQTWHSESFKDYIITEIEAENIHSEVHIYLEHRVTQRKNKLGLPEFSMAKGLLEKWTGLTIQFY